MPPNQEVQYMSESVFPWDPHVQRVTILPFFCLHHMASVQAMSGLASCLVLLLPLHALG